MQDYLPSAGDLKDQGDQMAGVLAELESLSPEDLLDLGRVAAVLGLGGPSMLDEPVEPRGYRLLAKIPRLPAPAAERLVAHFGGLHKLLAASVAELQSVDGLSESQALRGPGRAVPAGRDDAAGAVLLGRMPGTWPERTGQRTAVPDAVRSRTRSARRSLAGCGSCRSARSRCTCRGGRTFAAGGSRAPRSSGSS